MTAGVATLAFAAYDDSSSSGTVPVSTVSPAPTHEPTRGDLSDRTQPSLVTAGEAALLGTWTDGTNRFEFRPDGTVTFTYRTSCDGTFNVRNDILSVDFAGCNADAVQLSAPIFRNAVLHPALSGQTIVLEGDAGRFELTRAG